MRVFPVFLLFYAAVLIKTVVIVAGESLILAGFSRLLIWAAFFLLLLVIFNRIKRYLEGLSVEYPDRSKKDDEGDKPSHTEIELPEKHLGSEEIDFKKLELIDKWDQCFEEGPKDSSRLQDLLERIGAAFKRRHKPDWQREPREAERAQIARDKDAAEPFAEELTEIRKKSQSEELHLQGKSIRDYYIRAASVFYVLVLAGGLIIFAARMGKVLPLSYQEDYNYSILTVVFLLAFSFITTIYLKMRPYPGTRPGDKSSHGILTILSFVTLIYAAVIAANLVLEISILGILPWVYRGVSVYFIIVIAINLLISILKQDLLGDFNYEFLYKKGQPTAVDEILRAEGIKLNVSFKSLWSINYAIKIFPGLLFCLGAVLLLSTSIYVVQPNQQAAVYRFGRLNEELIAEPGLHLKLPWPIDKTDIYDVESVRAMQIGYEASETRNFLWNQTHDGGEYTLLLGNGNEAVAVNVKILYKIGDLYAYVKTCTDPESVLSAAAYEIMMNRTINTTLDAFLSIDRSSFSNLLAEKLAAFCEAEQLGLKVVQVIVESIHPPVEVADVYQKVVTASVDKKTIIAQAETYAEKELIYAEQESKTIVNHALSEQHRRISDAVNEMAVYYAAMEAYQVNPESFKLNKYLNAYETVIKGNKVYVFSPGAEGNISKFLIGGDKITLYPQEY